MFRHTILKTAIVLTVGMAAVGCAIFEVRDTYKSDNAELLNYKQDGAELLLSINPDTIYGITRFGSIGPIGLPVIPAYFNMRTPREIMLAVSLTLYHERDFSFAQRPCLNIESSTALCPYEIEISAAGYFQDDGLMYKDKQKRLSGIPNFTNLSEWKLGLPSTDYDRIDRRLIYQHYGYSGEPAFQHFSLNLIYKYRCADPCPEKLSLDTRDIAIEGLSIAPATVNFEKTLERLPSTNPIVSGYKTAALRFPGFANNICTTPVERSINPPSQ
jgi:hypothetical protein